MRLLAFLLLLGVSWVSAGGHPTLLSPHSKPVAVYGGKVFVTNTASDTLDVIDAARAAVVARVRTGVARVRTGVAPVSVQVRPDGKEIWVSNHLSDSVSVIDNDPESASYLTVVATVQDIDLERKRTWFDEPVGIAFASDAKAYVALSSTNRIAVVDVQRRRVVKHLEIPAQDPRALEVRDGKLYVLPFESGNGTQLSGGRAEDIDGDLVTFDARKLASAFDSVGFVVDVVKHPEVPDRDLFVFDTETDELVRTVDAVGTMLFGVSVDGDGRAFVAHTDARNHVNGRAGTKKHGLAELDNRPYLNRVGRIDADGEVEQFHLNPMPPEQPSRRAAVATPFGIRVSGDGGVVFVSAAGSDHLVGLDPATGERLGRVKVGAVPRGIALEENGSGAAQTAWVFNAVENSVTKVEVRDPAAMAVVATVVLEDPTPPETKAGRIAFNTARASSNGTFSCASCHADGHTDQLLWVLDTPHLVGADQIEPRLSQTLRGLRGTAPYHWDGVPGDPYGGPNASTKDRLPPNSDIDRPESAVRHVIDGSMASTMLAPGSDVENDEGKAGYLSRAERDAMAMFLLNLSHVPARGRPYTDEISDAARTGFERFHVTGARDKVNLNTSVCGSCHTMPYLATDQESMNVPSFRGALDRYITQAQGRNSVISLGGVREVAQKGFPEEEVWKRMLNMGEHGRLWPVIDMFKEASMGFSGAYGRQVTLGEATAEDAVTLDVLRALEKSAAAGATVVDVAGRMHGDGESRDVVLDFADGVYRERGADGEWQRGELVRLAGAGGFTGTFTARHGADVLSPPPAIWTAGVLHKQRGAQLFPRVNAETPSMVISALHVRDGATLWVDGEPVGGAIEDAGDELIRVRFDAMPAKGMRLLQVQNPESYLSNEFIFYVETRAEAVARYRQEPGDLLKTIVNSALINGQPDEARIAIEAGADLNLPHAETHFDKERPPIIVAAHYGRTDLVRELLAAGADPNIKTKNGDTALHRAAHLGRLEICRLLLEAGADPGARDARDKRPVELVGHFWREGNFEKHHAPWNVNLTLDHARYVRETPQVRGLLEAAAVAGRPNVVVLLADDLGVGDIGCYGGPVATPVLDGLAARGVRMTDFHAGAPVCSPSRATLLTGRAHLRTGVYTVVQDHDHEMHLLEREVTIAEHLKANGYQTAHFGKWHVGAPFRGRDKPGPGEHGFDYWLATDNNAQPSHRNPSNLYRNGKRVGEVEGYACQILADEAIGWLETEREGDRPFFLNVWFHEPHDPLAAPAEIVAKYGELDDPAAVYSATVENTDRAIGRLVKTLESMGELENTLIVYTSDHGSYRSERNLGLRGDKGSHFEGGLRTPGIFFWPGGIAGGRTEGAASGSVDLLPTLCGLLRLPRPTGVHLDGADLSPVFRAGGGTVRRVQPLFWHWPSGQPSAVLRDGEYTLVGYRDYEMGLDRKRIEELVKTIQPLAERELGRTLERKELFSQLFNSSFRDDAVERLRREFVRAHQFDDAWSRVVKEKGNGFRRFELYDLSGDPAQAKDLAAERPKVLAWMKAELLRINAGVLEDAPVWGEGAIAAVDPDAPDAELRAVFAKIERNELPAGYEPTNHQPYVDRRIAGMTEQQRGRLGRLWREKRRLDPDMKNRGQSFIRILEYVASQKANAN